MSKNRNADLTSFLYGGFMQNKKVELLAPAGSYESMKAAVAAGADAAVNLGQEHMRIIQTRICY